MSNELFRYRLLLRSLAPLILIFNAWQAIRARDIRVFRHRLGICLPRRSDRPLWLHAASVGELIAAQPLIVGLRERFPDIPIIVTTVTPTGANLAKQRLPTEVMHFYLPMDWPGATKRFLRAINPRAALIMETELWPNLFLNIARHDIPLIIVNGRLSSRTRDTAGWIRSLYAICLKSVNAILARSTDDTEAYIQLGASAEKVQTLGNIKFAHTGHTNAQAIDLGHPYILAASTHNNEEQQLAELWQNMGEKTHGRLLVIAPRHPQRKDDILRQLKNINVAVRSNHDTITDDTTIYLADTLGELDGFMLGADCVFMGGSLIPHGGQNILEPARLGKPIVFGPHMTNFEEETRLLLSTGGAKQVTDKQALQNILTEWLADPDTATAHGQRAAQLMAKQNNILDQYLESISNLCELEAH